MEYALQKDGYFAIKEAAAAISALSLPVMVFSMRKRRNDE
jgi:hypothetical protein